MNIDKIEDLSVLDDAIQLENAVFTELAPFSTLSAGIGTAAHNRDDRIVYDTSTGSLMYDADGNDSGHARAVAVLDAGLALPHAQRLPHCVMRPVSFRDGPARPRGKKEVKECTPIA